MASFGARHLILLFLSVTLMAACDRTISAPSTPPTITQFQAADSFDTVKDTLAIGQTLHLTGKISDAQGLKSRILTLLDSVGNILDTVDTTSIVGNNFTDLLVLNKGWGPTGSYTLRLTVTNIKGDVVHTDLKIRAKGTGGDTDVLLKSLGVHVLGAQGAKNGSFLDVTRDSVWSSDPKPYSHIDLVFGLDYGRSLALMSPSAANGDGFSLTSWDQLNSTTIVPSSRPLLTTGGVKATIDSGNLAPKVPAQRGWYALRLSTGALAALYVSLISAPSDTATATIEVFE